MFAIIVDYFLAKFIYSKFNSFFAGILFSLLSGIFSGFIFGLITGLILGDDTYQARAMIGATLHPFVTSIIFIVIYLKNNFKSNTLLSFKQTRSKYWSCHKCGINNYRKDTVCDFCGTPKKINHTNISK
ncbi:zinc finger Ran-binding domain-containing protein [Geothermobacter hydrogeniphilus]|uniref:RanBP2-type domain-containing protein n=1 Tax=Geothermobacter hydrogeniphilus TaxID=1969733 RepID=A0A1X0Y558_9BACT|nr:Ran-binding zinc finger domain-containing protein [Geothermobacter hydrogeniphilus]ORJ60295.1 hypothetical protein B5V00_08570 [Geothermobacter hydrogeniphilus]